MSLILGSHVSFNSSTQLLGSVEEALRYGSNTFMFYTGAPQNTKRGILKDELTYEAYKLMKDNGIALENVICHAPYIVNLCNDEKFLFSVDFLKQEMARCEQLGITKVVLHPGSSVGLEREHAISNIIKGLNLILSNGNNVTICLETMAGKGTEVGRSFEELAYIINNIEDKSRIGVCLDTCHISDAGYDVSDFDGVLDLFDKVIGLSYLKCLHINDSKNELGAHKDRHENFGYGHIGFDNLIKIVYHEKLIDIPKILESPYVNREYPPYKHEIEMIKNKVFNDNLIEDIVNYYSNL